MATREYTMNLLDLFSKAEQFVRGNGFGWEIDWCDRRLSLDEMDEQRFLLEYAWVVFNSGMRNRVIREKWGNLTEAFHHFIPLQIVSHKTDVRTQALMVFGNQRKVDAVIITAQRIVDEGFENSIRSKIEKNTLEYLDSFPFIGDVTKYHLARNLGFDYVKPDRHLVRLASKYGMTPFQLCDLIHQKTGRRLGTIDVILWRFCEQQGQESLAYYENLKSV